MENTREQKLKYAFGAHSSVKEFHVTSDDQMFLGASDANNHAKSLDDKDVVVEKRSDYVKSAVAPAPDNQLDLEREALIVKHQELFGQKPAKNAGIGTLQKKIDEEIARREEQAIKDAEITETEDEGSSNGDADKASTEQKD